jgi:hypothetical protein
MKQKRLLWLIALIPVQVTFAQIDLDNYATSYSGNDKGAPFIVAALPYNGVHFSDIDHSPKIKPEKAAPKGARPASYRQLNTFDSSDVYFFVPGIYKNNAGEYEFRILQNGITEMVPWSDISNFAANDLQINTYKRNFAFLGGYKTTWNNYLIADIRKKGTDSILSSSLVYWQPAQPAILNIYTPNDFNDFLKRLKRPYDMSLNKEELEKWTKRYPKSEIDAGTGLPHHPVFSGDENNLIFYLSTDIYKKEALEYEIVKDGVADGPWKPNEFDNNFIWLKNLSPGHYMLHMRFSAQRQHIATYEFDIQPKWNQTAIFKIIAGSLLAAFFLLLFRLSAQSKKLAAHKRKKETIENKLRYIRAQLNPHFVFNALSSIQGLINKKETEQANQYLSEFSSLLRQTISNDDKETIPLEMEINNIEYYIRLEQLRFHFQYSIFVDDKLNITTTEIPPFLIQPLIENSIKHGIAALHENGRIQLRFLLSGKDMEVVITDNGKGFDPLQPVSGFGIRLTKERINLLNQAGSYQHILLQIESAAAIGTTVHLYFKNWLVL